MPISAKVVANLLETVGVARVLTMDLHADQIQGFFDIPVDNIYASPLLLGDLRAKNYEELIVVSPDVGGVVRARALAKQLNCDLAIIDKRRPKANVSEVMNVIGEIDGRNCVIMDDMIDTAGTLVKAAEVLKERGARKVYAYCTHPHLLRAGHRAHRAGHGARRSGGDQHDPPVRQRHPLRQDPPALGGAADRRDDPAHRQGRIGDEFVLGPGESFLSLSGQKAGALRSASC